MHQKSASHVVTLTCHGTCFADRQQLLMSTCDINVQFGVQAAKALADPKRAPSVAGKAFFVTNQQPIRFWEMLGNVCEGLGYARPSIHLPFLLLIFIAAIFEYVIRPLLKPFKELNTDFTVNRMLIASTQRTFNNAAAIQHLGYKPKVPMDEALKRTLLTFEHLRNPDAKDKQSKKKD